MSAPFSPVPDDQDESIPAADAGAGAPQSSEGTGVHGEEPDRAAADHGAADSAVDSAVDTEADTAAEGAPDGATEGAPDSVAGRERNAELDEMLQGREDPPFPTPTPAAS